MESSLENYSEEKDVFKQVSVESLPEAGIENHCDGNSG